MLNEEKSFSEMTYKERLEILKKSINNNLMEFLNPSITSYPIDYSTAQNKPLIVNGIPVGVIKEYNPNGQISCILWDKCTTFEGSLEGTNKAIIDAVIVK